MKVTGNLSTERGQWRASKWLVGCTGREEVPIELLLSSLIQNKILIVYLWKLSLVNETLLDFHVAEMKNRQ